MNIEQATTEILDGLRPGQWGDNRSHVTAILKRFETEIREPKTKRNKLISFEDATSNEECLIFLVRHDGCIIDFKPASGGKWGNYYVHNLDRLKVGGRVILGNTRPELEVMHFIKSISETDALSIMQFRRGL